MKKVVKCPQPRICQFQMFTHFWLKKKEIFNISVHGYDKKEHIFSLPLIKALLSIKIKLLMILSNFIIEGRNSTVVREMSANQVCGFSLGQWPFGQEQLCLWHLGYPKTSWLSSGSGLGRCPRSSLLCSLS